MLNFNKQITKIEPSKIKEFNDLAKKLKVRDNLAIGEPHFDTPPNIKKACTDALLSNYTHYAPTAGYNSVLTKIACFENQVHQTNYDSSNIIITNGSTEGIAISLLTILNEDDEVIIFLPAYNLYRPICEYAKARVVAINTEEDGFQLNYQKLLKAVNSKTKAIIINTPNNPTGIIYNQESENSLIDVLKKNDLWLIMDNVYEQINFKNRFNNWSLMQNKDIASKIIICQSFSKSYAMTGWRIGYLIGNKNFIKQALKFHQLMMVSVNSFVQKSLIAALDTNNQEMIKDYQKKCDYAYRRLILMGLEVKRPSGGFYLFPSIKQFKMDSWTFCKNFLINYQTAILPGICFELDGYVRISFCTSFETLIRSLNNLEDYLKSLRQS